MSPTTFCDPPHRVHIVIYSGFKSFEAVAAATVLDYANAHLAAVGKSPAYDIHLVAPKAGLIHSDTLIALQAQGLDEVPTAHTAMVVGARDIEAAVSEHRRIVDWCRHEAAPLQRLVGVCSGAFFLAQAGLLDGLQATTHWSVAARLGSDFPAVKVQAEAIFIRNGRIWTCAGVCAVLDLSLALVEQDLGADVALAVARDLVIYLKRPGGEPQFSQHLGSQMTPHDGVRELQQWILGHLDQTLDLDSLAARANMSPRNLRRVFHRHTGRSPAHFIERARLEQARRLLVDGDAALKRIAAQCGFGSEQHMRRVFQRHLGMTPRIYRAQNG
ncbi:GlxA family transcriptional regulator [Pseudomonas sp. SC11]|uniref:GlxA family transcriptional regulator n=1 Tax=Pseudomonas sp. SC11 TaxID=326927 RepID=UPI00399BA433